MYSVAALRSTNAQFKCSMMRLIYLLLQYDQNNAQKYDQSDVHCQRSYYDVTIVRPILVAARRRLGYAAACLLGLRVRIPTRAWMSVWRVAFFRVFSAIECTLS